MTPELIKQIADQACDETALDMYLSLGAMMASYRSCFLGQQARSFSSEDFDILRRCQIGSLDFGQDERGDVYGYFCIPIILSDIQSVDYYPVVENLDPAALVQQLTKFAVIPDAFEIAPVVLPKPTLFGGNVFTAFDVSRHAFPSSVESGLLDEKMLAADSEGQLVFYLVGREKYGLSGISSSQWSEAITFYQELVSRCCGVSVQVLKPRAMSQEYSETLFRDVRARVESQSSADALNSIKIADLIKLIYNPEERTVVVVFRAFGEDVACIDMGVVSDVEQRNLIDAGLRVFADYAVRSCVMDTESRTKSRLGGNLKIV